MNKSFIWCLLPALVILHDATDIHIWEPTSLRNLYSQKPLSYSIANFGTVPYGHSIYGTVFKATPLDGCNSLAPLRWDKNSGTLIIFVERGNCHFAEKVLNAQKAGAGLVLIGDTADEDVTKVMPVERTVELLNRIHIPSILIGREDLENFKRVFDSNNDKERAITMAVNFNLVKKSDLSSVKMILQVDDFRSYDSVASFSGYYKPFQKYMDLTIHYKIFKNLPLIYDAENCIEKDALYCIMNTNPGKKNLGLLKETMKQICLFENGFEEYVKYMKKVRSSCFDGEGNIQNNFKNCTTDIFESMFNTDKKNIINECTNFDKEQSKEMFEKNNEKIKYNLINYSPIIFINGYFYKGNFQDSGHLMEAFCNSFEVLPAGCDNLEAFQSYSDFSSAGILKFVIVTILACFALTILTIGFFYFVYRKKITKKFDVELNSKINEALSKYYSDRKDDYEGIRKDY